MSEIKRILIVLFCAIVINFISVCYFLNIVNDNIEKLRDEIKKEVVIEDKTELVLKK